MPVPNPQLPLQGGWEKDWFTGFSRPLLSSQWTRPVQPWWDFVLQNRNDWSTKTEKQKKPKDNCKHTYALARIASVKATSNDPLWLPTFPTIIVSRGPSRTQMPAPRHIHLTCMLRMAEMIVFYRDTRTTLLEFLGSHTSRRSLGIVWTLFTLLTGSSRDSSKGPCWVPAESYRNVVNVVMLTIVSVLP